MPLPWLKLYRQIDRNVLYFSEPFDRAHAWIDLILLASDAKTEKLVGMKKVSVERGEVTETYDDLARRWKWSKTSVARFVDFLVSENMVEKKRNGRNVTLRLVKYEFFQSREQQTGTIMEQSRNDCGTIAEQSTGVGGISNIYTITHPREKEDKGDSILPEKSGKKKTALEVEFDEIWKLYPKKNGRKKAEQYYIKARKNGVTKETIESAIKNYTEFCKKTNRYFADGSTWFNQARWEDDYSTDYDTTVEPRQETMVERLERLRKEGRIDFE